jgi:hypothetical protein
MPVGFVVSVMSANPSGGRLAPAVARGAQDSDDERCRTQGEDE